jgi:DNA polymerase-3 subunit delta'
MLDEYKESQQIVYKVLNNAIQQERISHAYLFETNGYKDAKKVAIAFAKSLFCPNKYTNNEKCNQCMQCTNIDKNNFIELKIIEPDGMWIKKEQVDELQKEFCMKSVASNKKIYIIDHADQLNASSANTILKFLEEPNENIVAILLTENAYQMLETILSRCQIISFRKKRNALDDDMMQKVSFYLEIPDIIDTEEKMLEKMEIIEKFVKTLENRKEDTLLFSQRLWHEQISGKEMNQFAFDIMIYIYRDMLAFKLHTTPFLFSQSFLDELAQKNTIKQINQKLKIINELKENIKYNANIALLLDKLIIELSDV